ncbi:MAG: aminotransferase class I/II-fold pyridoxal phosphate-dependent enzyme [Spirochaetaceae bacterium]|nr:aminotransferase class I/II-fold pyridoxal phosphate-dependent enzyme [Spirochaetaceae bacterium]
MSGNRTYASRRLAGLGSYAFAEVDQEVAKLRARGIEPIDFGVGDPTVPTPEIVRRATARGVEERQSAGYPSYIGEAAFRTAVADWTGRRFGVALDPESEVSATIGAKEAVFNFHEAFVDPGDVVLCPSPGYPPYSRGTLFAEGEPYHLPLTAERDYLVDLGAIPSDVARRAKVLWINYPNSPSGAVAPRSFLHEVLEFAASHDLIVASDEAYSEIYFGAPPLSMLNVGKERVLVFNSLSKRSAMTTYRIGWVAGDPELVALFRQVKTNIDSGTPTFIQDGAVAALGDESHVRAFREQYRRKRDLLCAALVEAGLPDCRPDASLYVWQRVPEHLSSVEFATALLHPEIAIVTTPGAWISDANPGEANPGEGYVRFALVPSVAQTQRAAELLRKASF